MSKKRVWALGLSALVGGVVASGVAVVNAQEQHGPGVKAVDAPVPALVREAAASKSSVARQLGVDVAGARAYALPNSGETVWLASSDDGSTCLFDAGGVTCSSKGSSGSGITLARLPSSSPEFNRRVLEVREKEGRATGEAIERATRDLPFLDGPAEYIGWVPAELGVTSVKLVSARGETISEAPLSEGFYDFAVDSIVTSQPQEIRLDRGPDADPLVLGPLSYRVK